tara:strand:- start:101 stop:784 length:684 start_codon:yes stop_codon:yes gene_type:complete
MSTLGQAKVLGGVGSILGLLGFTPYAGPVLSIVGFVLLLVAINSISNAVGDRSIFNNMIIATVLGIVGLVVGALTVFGSILGLVGLTSFNWNLMGSQPWDATPISGDFGDIAGFIFAIILGLVIIWIFVLISSVFLRKSYDSISDKLNVKMFRTAALLYLIGAALTIVLVGFIIIFVAKILMIVAFFSMPDEVPNKSATPSGRMCPGCGRPIDMASQFCEHCGKQLD